VRPLAVAAIVVALAPGSALAAAPARILELPGEALPPVPPLAPPQPPLRPGADVEPLRGGAAATGRVRIGIAADGSPTSVRVQHRLELRSVGDYALFVPAPVESVVATSDSDSQPGLRPNQIAWRGFAPGRRTLGADAELRVRDAAPALPVLIRVAPSGSSRLVVTIQDATRTVVRTAAGSADAAAVARALRRLRAAARVRTSVETAIPVRGAAETGRAVSAAFSIRGTISFSGGDRSETDTFSGDLGGAAPRSLRIRVRRPEWASAPEIRVVVEPAPAKAVARAGADLDTVAGAYLAYARTLQYDTFLVNPDPNGPSRTTYVYETASDRPATAPAAGDGDDGGAAVPMPLIAIGGALLVGALVVLWAHL
jgi:hypothetical protein